MTDHDQTEIIPAYLYYHNSGSQQILLPCNILYLFLRNSLNKTDYPVVSQGRFLPTFRLDFLFQTKYPPVLRQQPARPNKIQVHPALYRSTASPLVNHCGEQQLHFSVPYIFLQSIDSDSAAYAYAFCHIPQTHRNLEARQTKPPHPHFGLHILPP